VRVLNDATTVAELDVYPVRFAVNLTVNDPAAL
jgi:hypothetical protein